MSLLLSEILKMANEWINDQEFEQEMIAVEESVIEHNCCFSMRWSIKAEKNLSWEVKTNWVGAGRLLISKDGELVEFEGSAPGVDWIHHFELRIKDLEDCWYLEIPYSKENISKLKTALKCSTTELLKRVNKSQKIIYTEPKAWNNHFSELHEIVADLNISGINCQIEVKTRKKSN